MSQEAPGVTCAAGRTTLWVDSRRLEEDLSRYRDQGIEVLGVNPMRGFTGRDLEFLRSAPYVEALTIVSPAGGDFDLDPVRTLRSLRDLTVSAPLRLPVSELPALEVLRGVWHAGLDLAGCRRLRVLDLSGFRPRSRTLAGLPDLPALEELALVQPGVVSLDGVERFQALRRLDLAYAPRLRSLAGLGTLPRLEALWCQRCAGLDWPVEVAGLHRLRSLRLNGCGRLPSLAFLDGLPSLEEFRFVQTDVLDGDLRPLLRLRRVGFLARRHYSHTPEEVEALLRVRAGDAGPPGDR